MVSRFEKQFAPGSILTAQDANDFLVNRGYQFRETLVFETSGTFDVSDFPWLDAVRFRAVGGGGGGQARNTTGLGYAGGGGGGYAEAFVTDVTQFTAPLDVVVGGGGLRSTGTGDNAQDGGTSSVSFDSVLIVEATGGGAGGKGQGGTGVGASGGDPGEGTVGDILIDGQPGQNGFRYVEGPAGNGGDSLLGSGGAGGANFASGQGGFDGSLYGGGGGGTFHRGTDRINAGSGAPGVVLIDLYA